MKKKNSGELVIKVNWSSGRDPNEDRPFDEVTKGLSAEILWSFVLMGILGAIVVLIWLVSP